MTGRPRLWRDCRANAVIELALTLPILLVLLVGAFEIAVVVFVAGTLESAVLAASRYGATGQDDASQPGGSARAGRIRSIIAERTLHMVDMGSVTIRTLVYPSFAAIGKPEPFDDSNGDGRWSPGEPFSDINGNGTWDADMGKTGMGGPGDIVLYDVTYDTAAMTSLIAPLLGPLHHHAAVAVRNEPF